MKHSKLSCLLLAAETRTAARHWEQNRPPVRATQLTQSKVLLMKTRPLRSNCSKTCEALTRNYGLLSWRMNTTRLGWTTASAWWVKKTLNLPLGCYHPW